MSPSDHQREIDDLIQQYFPEPKPEQGNGHHPRNGKPQGLIRRSNGHAGGALSDDVVLDMCRKAKNAAKFAELFDDGDVGGYKSRSDADYALIGILKFYTQDPEQLEALMQLSALKRSKWDTDRGGRSWLRYSIDNALEEVGE